MLAGILAVVLVLAAIALLAVWVWAVIRFHLKWWATLLSGLVIAICAGSFVFFAGLLTLW